jgi:hypothetical protein
MTRIGADADTQLTEEFLLNVPSSFNKDGILEIIFNTLTPQQQMNVLIRLEELYTQRPAPEPVELVTYLEGELALVISIAIPNIMERISFWQKFIEEKKGKKYTTFDKKRT